MTAEALTGYLSVPTVGQRHELPYLGASGHGSALDLPSAAVRAVENVERMKRC